MAFGTTLHLNLGFNNETPFEIIPKLTRYGESLFGIECDVASRNRDIVGAHKMSGLVLVESDIAQLKADKLS